MVQKIKEVRSPKNVVLDESTQTPPERASRYTPEPRKRLREPTVTPEVMAAEKPVEKRPKSSKNPEEWVEVPLRGLSFFLSFFLLFLSPQEETEADTEETRATKKGPL